MVQYSFTSTEIRRLVQDGQPRTATSTLTYTAPELWYGGGPFCFTSTEARCLIRDGDMPGGKGRKSEGSRHTPNIAFRHLPPKDVVNQCLEFGLEARPRIPPEQKTGETAVDRRQNNGSIKAVSPSHCPATCALRNCCFNCCAAWAESQRQCPLHCCWRRNNSANGERSPT